MIHDQNVVHFETLAQELYEFIEGYADLFKSRTHSYLKKAKQYVSGLFQAEKRNIETISDTVKDSECQTLTHLISESPWNAKAVMARIGTETGEVLQQVSQATGHKIGYILDESGWRKYGTESVGVARQYLRSLGKVDNGQIAVFGSLVCDRERGLINTRVFLPACWMTDPLRCDKVGIPRDQRIGQTKPMLGLEMVREDRARGLQCDWVGGDGLSGHDSKLRYGLADDGERYVLDIHADDAVYLSAPHPYVPARRGNRGRHPSHYQVDEHDAQPIEVRQIAAESQTSDWKQFS